MKCQIHNMIIHIIHLRLDGSCTSRQHPLLPKAALCHICHGNAMVTPWNQDEQEEHTADHQGLGRQRSSSFRCWARVSFCWEQCQEQGVPMSKPWEQIGQQNQHGKCEIWTPTARASWFPVMWWHCAPSTLGAVLWKGALYPYLLVNQDLMINESVCVCLPI